MSIDISKLEKVKIQGDGSYIARCPACALENRDHLGNHLKIFKNGAFNCIVGSEVDSNHNKKIASICGGEFQPEKIAEEQIEIERVYDVAVLDRLVKDYKYWEDRGIPKSVIEPFRGGIAAEGQMAARFIFPCFGLDGQLIGFAGRSIINKEPKWKLLGPKNKFIFGNTDMILDKGEAILVESIGDLLALNKYGIDNVLVLFGVNISQNIMGFLIAANVNKIIISTNLDTNQVGQNAAIKIKDKLSKLFNEDIIFIVLPKNAKDFGECKESDIEEYKKEIGYGE